MTTDEIVKAELDKCNKSPYYFAITYLRVTSPNTQNILPSPFKTNLTEEQFNREFFRLQGHNNLRKSEQLEQELAKEDNNMRALGIMGKMLREKRAETWEEWKEKIIISELIDSYEEGNGVIEFKTNNGLGDVQYYPKANKIHINETNKWIQPGLRWLIQNFINDDNKTGTT